MLIVQAQALLDVGHPSTLVVPLTTRVIAATELLRIRIPAAEGLQRDSDVLIDQVQTGAKVVSVVSGQVTCNYQGPFDENLRPRTPYVEICEMQYTVY